MEADITPEPSLNAERNKTHTIDHQYDGKPPEQQSCMVGGNVPFESEGKGCHIRRRNQPNLCTDDKDRPVLKYGLSVAANETMKQ
jgi:hypothetical protein